MTKHTRTKSAPNPQQSSELTHNYLKKISQIVSAVITVLVVLGFGVWVLVLWYQTSQVATSMLLLPLSPAKVDQPIKYAVVSKLDSAKPSVRYIVLTEPKVLATVSAVLKDYGQKKIDKKAQSTISLALGMAIEHILFVPDLPGNDPTLSQTKAGISFAVKNSWNTWSWRERHHWLQSWGAASNISDEAVTVATVSQLPEWQAALKQLASGEVSRECAVAVVNTTSQSGVARRMTQVLEQSGLYVIRVTDSFTQDSESQLVYNPEFLCNRELDVLASVVPNDLPPVANGEIARKYRADAVLLIGEDLATLVPKE